MAGRIDKYASSPRKRVFVLVDKGIAQGVFPSWDSAEAYADENRFSLDHLMEYETLREDPDHLHLMAVFWEDSWKFHGQWSKVAPDWPYPPKKIRLDHYHRKGSTFKLFRQKEFNWESGILLKINPMAPDHALVPKSPTKSPAPTEDWQPKLSPLKPIAPKEVPAEPVLEPEPAIDDTMDVPEPEAPPVRADKPKAPQTSTKPTLSSTKESARPPAKTESNKVEETPTSTPKISFQKKSPLKLKSKGIPQPIPTFKPTLPSVAADPHTGQSTVEIAQADLRSIKASLAETNTPTGKPRKIWSLRFLLTVAAVVLCWTGGLFWVLRPQPTAANVVAEITSLSSARKLTFEPNMAFFQLEVDPIHQARWIQSLRMEPVPLERGLTIPTYHALTNWEKPGKFIRPPYALVEVDEWWALRSRNIQYGFVYEWEDGSILILDLESDLMIGWTDVSKLSSLMN